jgi:hypothetical protein
MAVVQTTWLIKALVDANRAFLLMKQQKAET